MKEAPINILITDDEIANLNLLRDYLESSGNNFVIFRANNGLKAIEIARKEKLDLILLDWEMPNMTGIEALKILKSEPLLKDIPVLMATARTSPNDLEVALEAGAMDYIKKPVEKVELLARVRSAIKLRLSYKDLEEAKKELEESYKDMRESIEYAKHIQMSSLASPPLILQHFHDGFIFYQPKDIVSGDFYWFTKKMDELIIACIDCTGHGVPGAFMTMMGNALLNEIVNDNGVIEPSEILKMLDLKVRDTLNQQEKNSINDGMDMTLLKINKQTRKAVFAGAKSTCFYFAGQSVTELKGSTFAIGSEQQGTNKCFQSAIIDIEKDSVFYLFSDGFQDQFGGQSNKKYMRSRFKEFLLSINDLNFATQYLAIENELKQWKGKHNQTDDILVIGLKI
jgi:phosphoserine phosphatase RsbU/P